MRRPAMLSCWLALGILSSVRGDAPSLPAQQRDQASAWVKDLGSKSFRAREEATRKLFELGRAGKVILEEGLKSNDREVRRRCETLLELANRSDTELALAAYMEKKDSAGLLKLPSFKRFTKLVGEDDGTKRMFVDMYCAEGTMLAEMDKDPKAFGPKFTTHCQQIQQNMYTPWGQANPISHARVLALLFMGMDQTAATDLQSFWAINNLFYQQPVQQGFRDHPASRKMLVSYLETRSNPSTVQQVFYIARTMQLKEALPIAVKAVQDKASQGFVRGQAILFIGSMGGRENMKDLEALLTDKTNLGSMNTGTMQITVQMRDVALAGLIQLSGQNVQDYEFPYLKQFRGYKGPDNLPPQYYGFQDEAGREAVFKKWKDSQPKK